MGDLALSEGTKQKALRIVGAASVVEGLALAGFGTSYVRLWRRGEADSLYHRTLTWLAERPGWMLRVAGLAEVGAGLVMLGRAPLTVGELYEATAGFYETIDVGWRTWLYADAHRAFERAAATHLPPDGRVLDLGCGTGANLARLLDMNVPFKRYVGVDLTEAMLDKARQAYGERDDVDFERLDVETDPLPEGPFDLILSSWTFEHLSNPRKVVHRAWSALRPGGYMVLFFEVDTGYWWGRVWHHALRFMAAEALPEEVYLDFPGIVAVEQYRGPFGDVALVMIRKPNVPETA